MGVRQNPTFDFGCSPGFRAASRRPFGSRPRARRSRPRCRLRPRRTCSCGARRGGRCRRRRSRPVPALLDRLHQVGGVLGAAQIGAIDDFCDAGDAAGDLADDPGECVVARRARRLSLRRDGHLAVVHLGGRLQYSVGVLGHVLCQFGRRAAELALDIRLLGMTFVAVPPPTSPAFTRVGPSAWRGSRRGSGPPPPSPAPRFVPALVARPRETAHR